jgi:beta-lactamase class A
MSARPLFTALGLICLASVASAGSLDHARLTAVMERALAGFDGEVGVCVRDSSGSDCIHGGDQFPMQSVMKLVVAVAALDAADRGGLRLTDDVLVRREDLALGVQPIAKLVTAEGYRTTIGDLLSRMVVDSDSAATDILIQRLGGPAAVQAVLTRNRIDGVRVDRDERHLQTEIAGLSWQPDYVDPRALRNAIAAVPEGRRQASFEAYLADPRDTATPDGMVALLAELQSGHLLSPASTRHLVDTLQHTVTFPDRLKAGLPTGWSIGHKTGSGGAWKGITVATNDVGILTAPDGGAVMAAAFIKTSRHSETECNALIAAIGRVVVATYR